jgi:hypothetical protein
MATIYILALLAIKKKALPRTAVFTARIDSLNAHIRPCRYLVERVSLTCRQPDMFAYILLASILQPSTRQYPQSRRPGHGRSLLQHLMLFSKRLRAHRLAGQLLLGEAVDSPFWLVRNFERDVGSEGRRSRGFFTLVSDMPREK